MKRHTQRNARIEKGYCPQPRRVVTRSITNASHSPSGQTNTPLPSRTAPFVDKGHVQAHANVSKTFISNVVAMAPKDTVKREVPPVVRQAARDIETIPDINNHTEPPPLEPIPPMESELFDDAASVQSVSVSDTTDSTKPTQARKPRKKKAPPPAALKTTVLNIPVSTPESASN